MRLRDYLNGYCLALKSPLPAAEVEHRINTRAGSLYTPFASGVGGESLLGGFELSSRQPLWRHLKKPRLVGRIYADGTGSRIEVYFGASILTFAIIVIVYAFAAYLALGAAWRWWTLNISPGDPFLLVVIVFLLLMPVGQVFIDKAGSDEDFEALMDFIVDAAEAQIDGQHRPAPGFLGLKYW